MSEVKPGEENATKQTAAASTSLRETGAGRTGRRKESVRKLITIKDESQKLIDAMKKHLNSECCGALLQLNFSKTKFVDGPRSGFGRSFKQWVLEYEFDRTAMDTEVEAFVQWLQEAWVDDDKARVKTFAQESVDDCDLAIVHVLSYCARNAFSPGGLSVIDFMEVILDDLQRHGIFVLRDGRHFEVTQRLRILRACTQVHSERRAIKNSLDGFSSCLRDLQLRCWQFLLTEVSEESSTFERFYSMIYEESPEMSMCQPELVETSFGLYVQSLIKRHGEKLSASSAASSAEGGSERDKVCRG